ncbi:MAG: hypothetical protein AAGA18_13840 [Verrucomicrobiota bacterium]
MADKQFRVYFGNEPATEEELGSIESIVVEQEVDMAWEARLQFPLCMDEAGSWRGLDEDLNKKFSRVRIEIDPGDGQFIPLIDGPLVGYQGDLSSQPGSSLVHFRFQDDSAKLHRKKKPKYLENKSFQEIVEELFKEIETIESVEVDELKETQESVDPVLFQRLSNMRVIQEIAEYYNKHGYVLPAETVGKSIGCLKSYPNELASDGPPPLVVVGSGRNISDFHVEAELSKKKRVRSFSFDLGTKSIRWHESSFENTNLLGDAEATDGEQEDEDEVLIVPAPSRVDAETYAQGKTDAGSMVLKGEGSLSHECYHGVLQPYQMVTVKAGETKVSTNYVITRVTHTITPSIYTQSFSLVSNAISDVSISSTPEEAIF